MDPDKIQDNLKTKFIGSQILVFDSTASTNDIAAEYSKNAANNGLAIFAEEQTAGRGRSGNKWLAGKGNSILCSILLTSTESGPELLSLAAAVAVAEAIGNDAKIKWPNDIMLNGKKTAGILLETKKHKNYTAYILGIGINCHQQKKDFSKELQNTATSIDIETGRTCDRVTLAKRLLVCMEKQLKTAEQNSRKIIERWQKLSVLLHHRVTVIYNRKKFTGNCIGLEPQKGLILQLDSGSVRMFVAAHTTIAKN